MFGKPTKLLKQLLWKVKKHTAVSSKIVSRSNNYDMT
jgi:hypothetical protein